MSDEADDRSTDPFAPPPVPCEVCCLHCGETYESWQIEWRPLDEAPFDGAWCCPTPGCCAVGFGFDILPADVVDSDDDDDESAGEEFGADAVWLDVGPLIPLRRILGNTPQPPFDRMPSDDTLAAGDVGDDDELPF